MVVREKCTIWIETMCDVHCLHGCHGSMYALPKFVLQSFLFGRFSTGTGKIHSESCLEHNSELHMSNSPDNRYNCHLCIIECQCCLSS